MVVGDDVTGAVPDEAGAGLDAAAAVLARGRDLAGDRTTEGESRSKTAIVARSKSASAPRASIGRGVGAVWARSRT